jgi:NADPH-dependent 2,4-dienoyl-CoA reductase/sulfur reductase-like enzyme
VERLERHLIVGSGMTAIAAARAIRERDAGASIVIVGDEHDLPYKRPPLTKGLWQGKELDSVFYDLADLAVDLQLGRRIESLDLEARTATAGRGGSPRAATTSSTSGRSGTTAVRARSPAPARASR